MTRSRKLAYTALLFAAGLACVALASSSRSVGPLFLAWVPLLSVPYLLTRPEPGQVEVTTDVRPAEGDATPSPDDPGPEEPRPVDATTRDGTEGERSPDD